MSDLIILTPDNVVASLPDVPKLVQFAFKFGSNLRRGTLDVTLPDGRVVRCGGLEPGPAAQMTIHSYGFAWRLARSGDIGIAEAYLRREWDTPNLTQFLYIFCVNHDLIQTMLGKNSACALRADLIQSLAEAQYQVVRRRRNIYRALRHRQRVL